MFKNDDGCVFSLSKTLYKTQIRELTDERDEKIKLHKEAQQRVAEYHVER